MALFCHECNGTDFVDDRASGDTICTGCGLVAEAHAFQNPYVHDGAPLGTTLTSQTIAKCPRRLLYATGDASRMRGLITSSCDLQSCAARVGLPEMVVQTALSMWEKLLEERLCKGDLRKGLVGACLYFACKACSLARSKATIASACLIPVDVLAKAMKLYAAAHKQVQRCLPTESGDLLATSMNRVCGIPEECRRAVLAAARKIDERINATGVLEGKTPIVGAAAAIHIAIQQAGFPVTKLHTFLQVSHHTLDRTLAIIRCHVPC